MVIERINNEIVFRLSADMDVTDLKRIVHYLKYKEAIMKSKGTEDQANNLAGESKSRWWTENKAKYIIK